MKRDWFRKATFLARIFSLLAVLIASAVLVFGWILNIDVMRHFVPGLAGMAVSAAIGLIVCAAYLFLDTTMPRTSSAAHRPVLAIALLTLAIVNLTLVSWRTGQDIDHFIFGFSDERAEAYMSPATAICLALGAGCLLVSRHLGRLKNRLLFSLLATVGLIISTLALTGYAFDSAAVQEVFIFSAMALPTAAGFFLVFLAFLLSRPTWGWMRIVIGPGPGSETLRSTLLPALVGPFLFCWMTLKAVEVGLFNVNFRLNILAIATAASLAVLLLWTARRENANARAQRETNRKLERALKERGLLLREVYHRVKNNLQFIDAMLAMEAHQETTGELAERLAKIRMRVHALGLVHEQLVGSDDLATLDLRQFLTLLCIDQADGSGFNDLGIQLKTQIAPLPVEFERAIPIGLVVTELLSNIVKHAFPTGDSGEAQVTAELDGKNQIVLAIQDNGMGPVNGSGGGGIGNTIVRSLVAQLGGSLTVDTDNGYQVSITIPMA